MDEINCGPVCRADGKPSDFTLSMFGASRCEGCGDGVKRGDVVEIEGHKFCQRCGRDCTVTMGVLLASLIRPA